VQITYPEAEFGVRQLVVRVHGVDEPPREVDEDIGLSRYAFQ
jgi:hypothetical protein